MTHVSLTGQFAFLHVSSTLRRFSLSLPSVIGLFLDLLHCVLLFYIGHVHHQQIMLQENANRKQRRVTVFLCAVYKLA